MLMLGFSACVCPEAVAVSVIGVSWLVSTPTLKLDIVSSRLLVLQFVVLPSELRKD